MTKRVSEMNPYDMTNKQLLDEYNYLRNKIDGLVEGGFGKYELNRLSEVEHEMTKREEGK